MHWPNYEIRQIVNRFISGGTPSTKIKDYWQGNIPWITGADIINDEAKIGRRYINHEAIKNSASNIVPEGSILMVTRTGVGKIAMAPVDIAISQDLTGLMPKAYIDPEFLISAIKVKMNILLASQQGATIKGITRDVLQKLKINLPPLSEQKRIVEILGQADTLRKNRAEADKIAERIIPSLFYKMFGDPATNPMDWDTVKFEDIGTLGRGKSKHRPRNDPALLGGYYPLIQTGDVANSGGQITSYIQTYSEIGLRQSKMWPAGTLCITIAANIAKTGILEFDACFPDSIVGFIPDDSVTKEYVQTWLSFLQPVLEASAPQVAQKNINLEILRNLQFIKPPKPIQEKFTHLVKKLCHYQKNQLISKKKIEILFAVMMHRAFTGELTAKWREAHIEELLREMEIQAQYLNEAKV